MQALLEVKKGEKPYKTGISEWLRDEDGALIFKMISKKRADGQIQMVIYTQRSDAIKRVIQHISFAEKDFWGIMDAFQEAIKQSFPKFKMEVQNVDMTDTQTYHVAKNTPSNIWRLKVYNWFGVKINSLKTMLNGNKKY